MWLPTKTDKYFGFSVLCITIVIHAVPTSQQRRQGYQSRRLGGFTGGQGSSNLDILHAPQEKMASVYGEQLQNLDTPEYETPNYDFKYQVHGGGNYFGHEETRKDSRAQGRYHVLLPDGRMQVVTYFSDHTGYHPTIHYEVVGLPPKVNQNLNLMPQNDGYRSKRSRYYKHSKRVHLKHPVSFKSSDQGLF